MEYFAYGSNMDARRMRERVGVYTNRRFGILEGYRLCFNKTAQSNPSEGYANIEPDEASITEGVLYSVNQDAINMLDRCEGYPRHYKRVQLPVMVDGEVIVNAIAYIANPAQMSANLRPSREYIDHLLAGRDLLSTSYIQAIESLPTID